MNSKSKGVTVNGSGTATAPPDLVIVDVGVTALADTVAAASQDAARTARSVLDAFASSGIDGADIATTGYAITAEYDWQAGSVRRFLGYRVNNSLTVKIRELGEVGTILDRAVGAAGNAAEVSGLRFSIDDPSALESQARDLAWADAVAVATQLAGLAGRELGPATSITEVSGGSVPFPVGRMRAEMAAADTTTPIEGGSTTVRVTIEARFEFAD